MAIERPGLEAECRQILARRSVDFGESSASVEFALACFEREYVGGIAPHLRTPRADGGAGLDVDGRHVAYLVTNARPLPHLGELAPYVENLAVFRERCGVDFSVRHVTVAGGLRQGQGGGGAEDGLYHHHRGQNQKSQQESSVQRLRDQYQSSAHLYRALHTLAEK